MTFGSARDAECNSRPEGTTLRAAARSATPAGAASVHTLSDMEAKPKTYSIEGVMTNVSNGWIIALDRPYEGDPNEPLHLANTVPPVPVHVIGPVENEDGTPVPDVVLIYPVEDMNDPRMLVGRVLEVDGARSETP